MRIENGEWPDAGRFEIKKWVSPWVRAAHEERRAADQARAAAALGK
jgi:hypothetical protein